MKILPPCPCLASHTSANPVAIRSSTMLSSSLSGIVIGLPVAAANVVLPSTAWGICRARF